MPLRRGLAGRRPAGGRGGAAVAPAYNSSSTKTVSMALKKSNEFLMSRFVYVARISVSVYTMWTVISMSSRFRLSGGSTYSGITSPSSSESSSSSSSPPAPIRAPSPSPSSSASFSASARARATPAASSPASSSSSSAPSAARSLRPTIRTTASGRPRTSRHAALSVGQRAWWSFSST